MTAKYPHVKVKLTGGPSDPRAILSNVAEAMSRCGVPAAEREAFLQEAYQCQSPEQVLHLVMQTVDWS